MAPAELKAASLGSLTQKEAVALTLELVAGFGAAEFQAKLEDFRLRYFRAAPGKERNRLNGERAKLFLEVQARVLPDYGFSPDAKGVFQMSQAMQPHNPDGEWQVAAGLLNVACGLDAAGALVEPRRPQVRSVTPSGGPALAAAGTFQDGETGLSRFVGVPRLNGSIPCTMLNAQSYAPTVVGNCVVSRWDRGILALTPELDLRWRWKATGTMALASLGSRLFACTREGWALCLCLESGAELWRRRYSSLAGYEGACAASERCGGLLLAPGFLETPGAPPSVNAVFALSTADGSEVWSAAVTGSRLSHMGPVVVGEHVVTRDHTGSISCLRLGSGAMLWYRGGYPGMRDNNVTTARLAASQLAGLVCACTVPPGEATWNAPAGGKCRMLALDLETGRQRWEVAFDWESHVAPVILAERRVVLVALGNKAGPPAEIRQRKTEGGSSFPGSELEDSKTEGDSFPGLLAGLDIDDGAVLWTIGPRLCPKPSAAGILTSWDHRPPPWTEPVVGADGRVYTWFHGGVVVVLDGATGKVLETLDMSWSSPWPVSLGDGLLVLATWRRTSVFRWPPLPRPHLARPLAAPFEATGTEHFAPTKNIRNDHTLTSTWKGPFDLSQPAWSFETPSGRRAVPICNFNWYCNPLIDSQRNLYNVTETGWLYVHRPDGSLRGSLYLGVRGTTPVLDGTALYAANADGIALKADLETLEIIWTSKYAQVSSSDSWMPSLSEELLLVGGHLTKPGFPHPVIDPEGLGTLPTHWENNWWVFALERTTGRLRWTFTPGMAVYNLNPTFVRYDGQEFAIIMDCNGGFYIIRCQTGEPAWYRLPTHYGTFNDICGVTMGPDRVIYFGTQDSSVKGNGAPDRGTYPQQPGIIEAFDVSALPPRRKWEVKKPYSGMLQSVVAPAGEGKYVLVVPMGENGDEPCVRMEDRSSDTYVGILYGLDPETGEELWSFSPPPWKTENGSCRASMWWSPYMPASWCSPVVDGRGTLYIYWMGGVMYAIRAATGRVLSSYDLGCSVTGSPAVAPGLLVVQAQFRVLVWRDEELEDGWLREAEAAGDPRARLGRCSTSDEARQRGVGWGMGSYARPPADCEEVGSSPTAPGPTPAPAAPEGEARAEGRRYVVVGGERSGGISVRAGPGLKSAELPVRLATGAEVRELEVMGDRLRYEKVAGDGPDSGWVSKSFKGKNLIRLCAS